MKIEDLRETAKSGIDPLEWERVVPPMSRQLTMTCPKCKGTGMLDVTKKVICNDCECRGTVYRKCDTGDCEEAADECVFAKNKQFRYYMCSKHYHQWASPL